LNSTHSSNLLILILPRILAGGLFHRVFLPGSMVVTEQDDGDTMFILNRGCIEISIDGKKIAELEPEANNAILIGELCVLGVAPKRTASVAVKSVAFLSVI
jgi:hypothetical protein